MVTPKIPAPEPVAYLYTDARTPEGTHPWLRETMLVLACDRRHGRLRADGRREAALITLESAETYAAALAEKARQEERGRCIAEVGALHMAQTVNNQNHPRAWHDAVDAALAAIRAG
jgi:hypothetical protein